MSRSPRLTEQEREQRRMADRQRLQEAASQLLSSEGWARWVRVRSRAGLARLSLNNQLLVAVACPEATFVAGFKAWLSMGFCVRRGEAAIRIIAPMPVKIRDESGRADGDEEGDRRRMLFRVVSVFDRSQVAPLEGVKQASLEPPCEPLSGDSHAHLLPRLRAFTESLGYSVAFEPIAGSAGGWCDPKARRIVVDSAAPANARLRTLIHETVHALGVGYSEYGRERAEVIVDTATHLAASSVGLDVSGETVSYLAGWGEDGALEAVTEFAALIDALARNVETALADESVSQTIAA